MPGAVKKRVAIVTGGTRNIGRSIAYRLAADDVAVAVNHRDERTAKDAGEIVGFIRESGGNAISIPGDVAAGEAVNRIVMRVNAELGPPTILVNNAAVSVSREVAWEAITLSEWEAVWQTNVLSNFLLARAILPYLKDQNGGSIVNISSIRALTGKPGNLHYTTSKSAQIGLTRGLARELGPLGVRVNAVVPGAIRTPQEEVYGDPAETQDRVFSAQALRRRGEPDDVSEVVAFLCREEAAFITGQSIVVDGGWVMS